MEELGIINRKNGKQGWTVKCTCLNDIPNNVMNLLAEYGYTKDDLERVYQELR